MNHELDEWGHLVLDYIEPRVGPEEGGGEADGQIDGIHSVCLIFFGDAMEEGEEVVEKIEVLSRQFLEDPEISQGN